MDRSVCIRAAALYLPICFALIAGKSIRQPRRQFASCLLSLLWTLPALLALQRLNQAENWWTYATTGPQWRDIPVELYFGWAVLWGVFPQLALPRRAIWMCAVLMAALDLIAMPLCAPVVALSPRWLGGETVAIVLVLVPSLCIARWTANSTHLPLRALLQVAIAAGLFLFLVPESAFALQPGAGWQPLLQMPSWQNQIWLQIVLILAIPGLSAVMEFAHRGTGTPIPYDPPQRLVTSGMYRYVANPMQLSCSAVMLVWAAILRDAWLLLPAAMAIVYSAGIADWDEGQDLRQRFGEGWISYRKSVRNWRACWQPYHAGAPAQLYIASTCGPCTEVRVWIETHHPIGLTIVAAETLLPGSIQRMRYDPRDGTPPVEGVRAFARALEHLNLAWALAGAALRLPLLRQFTQLLLDAGGLGPRTIPASCPAENSPRSS